MIKLHILKMAKFLAIIADSPLTYQNKFAIVARWLERAMPPAERVLIASGWARVTE
jgi:hypothetical protein